MVEHDMQRLNDFFLSFPAFLTKRKKKQQKNIRNEFIVLEGCSPLKADPEESLFMWLEKQKKKKSYFVTLEYNYNLINYED